MKGNQLEVEVDPEGIPEEGSSDILKVSCSHIEKVLSIEFKGNFEQEYDLIHQTFKTLKV